MANYLPLEEAAKTLGVTVEELIEMRSRGEIFGLRDGSSWKFKSDEIERVQQERSGDVLDDDPAGSSILVSERDGGSSKSGLVLSGEDSAASISSSDLRLNEEDGGSDVALIPDPSSGSGLRLVNRAQPAPGDGDDDVLSLDDSEELELDANSLSLGPGSNIGSNLGLGSELRLASDDMESSAASATPPLDGSQVIGGSELKPKGGSAAGTPDLVRGDSDADIDLDGDLQLAGDDDLVLGSASDLGLGSDSGINLMSPSDSGLSLEDEPIDLAGTGISGLDLGGSDASASGSDVGSGSGGSGGGLSGIDFAAAEDFQLSPSDGMEIEEDSGSQVIEIEDSTDMSGMAGDAGMGALVASGDSDSGFMDDGLGASGAEGNLSPAAAAYRGTPEVPLGLLEVGSLLCIILIMGLSGILITDIVRNMWAWNGETQTSLSTWFTQMVINAFGMRN